MRRWLQALVLAALVIVGGSIAPPARAWKMPAGHHCSKSYFVSHQYGRCGWIRPSRLIRIMFAGPHMRQARCVAYRESHYYIHAVNRYSGAAGLFQWLPSWWLHRWDPFDAPTNAWHAYTVSRNGVNWHPWTTARYC